MTEEEIDEEYPVKPFYIRIKYGMSAEDDDVAVIQDENERIREEKKRELRSE